MVILVVSENIFPLDRFIIQSSSIAEVVLLPFGNVFIHVSRELNNRWSSVLVQELKERRIKMQAMTRRVVERKKL